MLKTQGSEARGRELKSHRLRELDELRSRGVAKSRREKLQDFSFPLQSTDEAQQFLLTCRDQTKRETFKMPAMHPSMSAVDYNSFLMDQTKRQRELKMRRREAEQLLHGFRGFYGESFASWSPRKRDRNSASSFGFTAEDSLVDPDDDSRRQTALPRLETGWGEEEERDDNQQYRKRFTSDPQDLRDDNQQYRKRFTSNPLDPHCRDFLIDDRHYDGTEYSRTQQDMEVASGVSMFSPREGGENDNQFREIPPSSTRSLPRTAYFQDRIDADGNTLEGPPLSTRSLPRTAYFQDRIDASRRKDFSRADVMVDGNTREGNHTSDRFQKRPPSSTRSTTRDAFFQDRTDAPSRDFDRSGVGFIENTRLENVNNEFREKPPSSTRSTTRDAFFQDHTDAPSGDFDRSGVGFIENTREAENVNNEFREKPPSSTRSYFDRAAVGFDGKTREGEHASDNLDERESTTHKTPCEAQRMKLEINTEREDIIDVTASEKRLRQAGGGLEERESCDETGSREGERPGISNKLDEHNTTPSPPRVDQRASKIELSEPASREEAMNHDQEAAPVPETIWRNFISSEPGAKFPPEAGRYHLYASYACPGSHRALIVRALKGLEDIVSVTIVHPTWRHTNPDNPRDKHRGWIFGDPDGVPFHNTMGRGGPFPPAYPDNTPDPVLNAFSVRNLYEYANDTSGKYTIPLLWDTKLNTIVNNESSDISYMLNSSFNDFTQKPELDLYTEDDEDGLDRLNEVSQWLYPMMIHGVYRCGFAKTQRAYDHAIEELTEAFDAADQLLQQQRYLTGDTLTDADIRFFVTLLRFDEVYAFYFRANTRLVLMTPSLLNFCREIYQIPGVASTCQMDQIKAHFFGSHAEWNKYSVVPRGLDFMRYLEMPHDREQITGFGHC